MSVQGTQVKRCMKGEKNRLPLAIIKVPAVILPQSSQAVMCRAEVYPGCEFLDTFCSIGRLNAMQKDL